MGSDSDLPVVEKAMELLEEFGVPYEVHVLSAHRTPDQGGCVRERREGKRIRRYYCGGREGSPSGRGHGGQYDAAGNRYTGEVVDAGWLDALLATVQMPSGMPVATVAIDGAANAALLAVQILAVSDETLADKLTAYRQKATDKVLVKNIAIEERYNKKQKVITAEEQNQADVY